MKYSLFFGIIFWVFQSQAQSYHGTWLAYETDGTKKSHLDFYKVNGKLYAKLVYYYPNKKRGENPVCSKCEGERKNQPIIGMQLTSGLVWNGAEWDGKMLDPETGKWYKIKIWIDKDNHQKMYVRGYLGVFFETREMFLVK